MAKVSASILACDHTRIGEQVSEAERAGTDIVTFQLDACPNPIHMLREVKKVGLKAGMGIGPVYDVENI